MDEKKRPVELIVMLTRNDRTAGNAAEIFEQCRETEVLYWGMKDQGLPLPEMKRLYREMKGSGKKTVMEVVGYTAAESAAGAEMAAECGCDILMGTHFTEEANAICRKNGMLYMPFIGNPEGRPSVLRGSAQEMLRETQFYLERGAFGVDLLGYRYEGDAGRLIRTLTAQICAPVCLAGSINSFDRLDTVKRVRPWAFTIGSAFFTGCFGKSFPEQIEKVFRYLRRP